MIRLLTQAPRADLTIAAVFCGVVGVYDVLYVFFTLNGGPAIGYRFNVVIPDFLVFHAAAQAFAEGLQAKIYDIEAFSHLQKVFYPERFPGPTVLFRPFFYPPTWLLMLVPFGVLAVAKAYALFMATTVAIATALEGRYHGWAWLAVVTCPAAVWAATSGQNSFLAVALLYGGLRWLDRSPAAAGILFGLLSYKPHIWLLIPLALLAAREWKALAWTIGAAIGLAALSAAVFGIDLWIAFFELARTSASSEPTGVAELLFSQVSAYMTSFMAAGRTIGLTPAAAGVLQFASAALACAAVWVVFSRNKSSDARTAILAAATLLFSPYLVVYDLLLLMPAAVMLYRQGTIRGFYLFERAVLAMVWLIPLFGIKLHRIGLPVTPLIVLMFGIVAWMHLLAGARTDLGTAPRA